MTAPEAHAIRGGHQVNVPARELVPGDVVLLEAGNYVPADLRLIEAVNLKIEEASLTGEAVPVEKEAELVLDPAIPLADRTNAAYMSTIVTYGRGRGRGRRDRHAHADRPDRRDDPELRDRANAACSVSSTVSAAPWASARWPSARLCS